MNQQLGYVLEHQDGKEEFVPVFEGETGDLELLKNAMGPLEYHGKKCIKDCRWKIRPAEVGEVA